MKIGGAATRVAIVCDLSEEQWPSMDLVAQMLERHLTLHSDFEVIALRPPMQRRMTRLAADSQLMFNTDRLCNRFWDYPRWLRSQRNNFDVFHVIDHSYSQLVHELPSSRTVVTCHDVDTFRCLFNPPQEKRSVPFRSMVRRILSGLQRAARVTCDSASTQDELLENHLVDQERVTVVPNGVHPSCSAGLNFEADAAVEQLLGAQSGCELVHVGSTIQRKRIDVLLRVLGQVRVYQPDARLIRVGGPLTPKQQALAKELGVAEAIVTMPRLDWNTLAAVYRRVHLALLTSDREGFGLPLAESMACGTPVVASDLAVLREVGGSSADYCPVEDIDTWTQTIVRLTGERTSEQPAWRHRQERCIKRASEFTWSAYARRMATIYGELLAN